MPFFPASLWYCLSCLLLSPKLSPPGLLAPLLSQITSPSSSTSLNKVFDLFYPWHADMLLVPTLVHPYKNCLFVTVVRDLNWSFLWMEARVTCMAMCNHHKQCNTLYAHISYYIMRYTTLDLFLHLLLLSGRLFLPVTQRGPLVTLLLWVVGPCPVGGGRIHVPLLG